MKLIDFLCLNHNRLDGYSTKNVFKGYSVKVETLSLLQFSFAKLKYL